MTHIAFIASLLLLATFLVLAPLVAHEMGHWAVLRRYGVPVREYWLGLGPAILCTGSFRVGMLPIGGAIVPDLVAYAALTPLQRVAVALAGPAASFLYGFVFWCAALINQTIVSGEILFVIANMSLILGVLNLLPLPPLDGFQAWVSWREHLKRPLAPVTLRFALRFGNGLVYGVGFMVLGLFLLR